jgi:hypothetical protein
MASARAARRDDDLVDGSRRRIQVAALAELCDAAQLTRVVALAPDATAIHASRIAGTQLQTVRIHGPAVIGIRIAGAPIDEYPTPMPSASMRRLDLGALGLDPAVLAHRALPPRAAQDPRRSVERVAEHIALYAAPRRDPAEDPDARDGRDSRPPRGAKPAKTAKGAGPPGVQVIAPATGRDGGPARRSGIDRGATAVDALRSAGARAAGGARAAARIAANARGSTALGDDVIAWALTPPGVVAVELARSAPRPAAAGRRCACSRRRRTAPAAPRSGAPRSPTCARSAPRSARRRRLARDRGAAGPGSAPPGPRAPVSSRPRDRGSRPRRRDPRASSAARSP